VYQWTLSKNQNPQGRQMVTEFASAICLSDKPEVSLTSAGAEMGVSVFHVNDMAQADALMRISPRGWHCIFVVVENIDDLVRYSQDLVSFKGKFPGVDIVICSASTDTLHLLRKLPVYGVNVLKLPADRLSLTQCIAETAIK